MNQQIEMAQALEPRSQSTRQGAVSEGLAVPRPNDDGRTAFAFVAGVVLTAAAFVAGLPFLTHH